MFFLRTRGINGEWDLLVTVAGKLQAEGSCIQVFKLGLLYVFEEEIKPVSKAVVCMPLLYLVVCQRSETAQ